MFYTRKQVCELVEITFYPLIKWNALFLATVSILFAYLNVQVVCVLALGLFIVWLGAFLWSTKEVREDIRVHKFRGIVEQKGSDWSLKNPSAYVLK